MLTDEQIEKLLYEYAKRQDEFSLAVIRIIANRLSKLADFDKLSSLERLEIMQKDIYEIEEEFASYKNSQKRRIRRDWWWIAEYIYGEALLYYETQLALQANEELATLIEEAIVEAQKQFGIMVKKPVFTIRDFSNPALLHNYNLAQTYRTVMEEASTYRNLSDELARHALKRTETQLFNSGVRYMRNDTSNRSMSGNSVVRANILDGMKNLINRMQEVMGKQFGADGVELSAHIYPAPDHAPAQGHQYTNENVKKMQSGESFEDTDGHKYMGFERQIGQWNCRHYFMKVKLGKNPTYTQEELDKILADNGRGYTTPDGKHYTLYECTQIQRRYERNIRSAKEKYLFAKSLDDQISMLASRTRVGSLTSQYKQFSHACGIAPKLERIKVKDY